ncbi:MAG: phosphoribosylglycinamide synthetase C domain-containing protein, partial [bacterium]|nr:phosphoribosylglycinamide synthetase C domain-containing protein [bacterium]
MKTDLIPVLNACVEGNLKNISLQIRDGFAVCVILASGGYPEKYEKGKKIIGLNREFDEDVIIFHAGTRISDGEILTNGGRVLGVTALG